MGKQTKPSIGTGAKAVVFTWLGTRALMLAVMIYVIATTDRDLAAVFNNWDVTRFLEIGTGGYPDNKSAAFFPGLPLIYAALALAKIPALWAGVVLAQLGSAGAAWALYRLFDARIACMWLLLPMSVFTFVPYTEPLFCAFAFWAWERASKERWHYAALFAALAASLRISGLFLIGALVVMALIQDVDWKKKGNHISWILLAFLPIIGYVIFLHSQTGSWLAWYDAQHEGWQRTLAWPWDVIDTAFNMASYERWPDALDTAWMFRFEILSVLVGYFFSFYMLFRKRIADAAWIGLNVIALSCSGWFVSVTRSSLLWFPMLVGATDIYDSVFKDKLMRIKKMLLVSVLVVDLLMMMWWTWCFSNGRWAG